MENRNERRRNKMDEKPLIDDTFYATMSRKSLSTTCKIIDINRQIDSLSSEMPPGWAVRVGELRKELLDIQNGDQSAP